MTEMVLENNQVQELRARKLSIREVMKNEKGLTLIELLAVIVIIAIIAAIAIPSIGSIMEKTRLNAHRSNAHMVIDAARLYVTNEGLTLSSTTTALYVSLKDLHDKGYLQTIPKDPSHKPENYDDGAATTATAGAGSFVKITKESVTSGGTTSTGPNYLYEVTLQATTGGKATPYMSSVKEADIEATTSVEE